MLLLHRVFINLRRVCLLAYYKLIFRNKLKYGGHFRVRGSFKLYIEPTGHIQFGDNCFVNNYFSATSIESIKIGDNCLFGEGVKIYDHNHNYKDRTKLVVDQGFTSKPVVIGNNCWIASNVTILAGVTIGDNCVIGANCLIYKDIPANSVVKHGEDLIISGGGYSMRPKVSVIIPVYKVEKYLARCLDSVLAQTLKEIEIILVDDGSPDNCGKICDAYAEKDNRIKVIHKKNAGVSSARNSGLEAANGEYIGFVDSDDFVAPTMFEILYRQAVLADADMSMCNFAVTDGDTSLLSQKGASDNREINILDAKKAFIEIADFSKNLQVTVWDKIYRQDLIGGLLFDTNKAMSEDLEFLMRAVVKSRAIVYIPEALYGYFAQREGAATFHARHDISWYLTQNEYITAIMKEVASTGGEFEKLAIGYKCVNGDLSIANAMVRKGKLDREATRIVRRELIANMSAVICSELHVYKKIQMLVFIVSPRLYMKLMKYKVR